MVLLKNAADKLDGEKDKQEQWRINNGAIGARAPGPRAQGGPLILNKQLF